MTVANTPPKKPPPANVPPHPAEMPTDLNRPLAAHQPPTPTPAELGKAHQRVVLHNTDPVQTHVFHDRHLRPQTLRPGEKLEVDMNIDAIAYLHDQSRTDRGFYMSGPNIGKPFPPHPVRIVGIPPAHSRPDDGREAAYRLREAELDRREAALAEREALKK
jgi:hypothetical protein